MRFGHYSNRWSDSEGNDVGGVAHGMGFTISWQNGPLAMNGERQQPNGAFVEDVLEACKARLEMYQDGNFPCDANALAIARIANALEDLDNRTKDRESRGVEGTHAE